MKINKVIDLYVDEDDWDTYIGYMAMDYRDIWINHYDVEDGYTYNNTDFNALLDTCEEFKKAKELLKNGNVNYIILRADID